MNEMQLFRAFCNSFTYGKIANSNHKSRSAPVHPTVPTRQRFQRASTAGGREERRGENPFRSKQRSDRARQAVKPTAAVPCRTTAMHPTLPPQARFRARTGETGGLFQQRKNLFCPKPVERPQSVRQQNQMPPFHAELCLYA